MEWHRFVTYLWNDPRIYENIFSITATRKTKVSMSGQNKLWWNTYLPAELRRLCFVGMETASVATWLDETTLLADVSVLTAGLLCKYKTTANNLYTCIPNGCAITTPQYLLSVVATTKIVFVRDFFSVTTITHKPRHLAQWNLAPICTLTTARNPENFKVIGQSSRSLDQICGLQDGAKKLAYIITHKPLHPACWNFAQTCTSITYLV